MARCLRCGAGNEWIEPVQREDTDTVARIAALRAELKDAQARADGLVSALEIFYARRAERDRIAGPCPRYEQQERWQRERERGDRREEEADAAVIAALSAYRT